MGVIIKAEKISKQYRLGEIGTGTISHDLNRWWHKFRGKDDPYVVIGESNDRTSKGATDYVWALKDINFEVEKGDVLGIVGRNGAGKSTILKILSRTTAPTTGSIKIKGRIASLLEVGTGFHPELSGRDNIYLNGAILGMSKKEITKKFEQIVDFAGVERYIDTPVKRYSSGMYVRLAFGVAAHLESEILIVDEVLAVGDAEFQKKCLDKMGDVSNNEGRTVLFVSHNLQAISTLTKKVILLSNGTKVYDGDTAGGISQYLSFMNSQDLVYQGKSDPNKPVITLAKVNTSEINNIHNFGSPFSIDFEIDAPDGIESAVFSFQIINSSQVKVLHVLIKDSEINFSRKKGIQKLTCKFPNLKLYPDKYTLMLHLSDHISRIKYQTLEGICPFEIQMMGELREYYWKPGEAIYNEEILWIIK